MLVIRYEYENGLELLKSTASYKKSHTFPNCPKRREASLHYIYYLIFIS